ncbi:hypothetical protein [Mycobacterium colombiense]|nr:hypothetical protein [Mycobacterium colombiense]
MLLPTAVCPTEEGADLVVMLASDRGANVMGAGVTIDGGMVPTL